MRVSDEQGEVISSWLVQLLAIMLVLAFIGYEAVSIAMTHLSLDEDAREVAAASRSAYGGDREVDDAIEAGREAAEVQGIDVLDVVEVDGDPPEVAFELGKQASTLVIHRIGFLEDMTYARTNRRVPLMR